MLVSVVWRGALHDLALFQFLPKCSGKFAKAIASRIGHATRRSGAYAGERGLAWSFARSRAFSISTKKCSEKFAKAVASRIGHATRRSGHQWGRDLDLWSIGVGMRELIAAVI
jgi:hypothetical protein